MKPQVVVVFTIEQAEWLRDYLRVAAERNLMGGSATAAMEIADMIEDVIVNDG